jgi:hypothetical protein
MRVETILISRSSNLIGQEFPFLTLPLTPPSPPASGKRKVVGSHLKNEVLPPPLPPSQRREEGVGLAYR